VGRRPQHRFRNTGPAKARELWLAAEFFDAKIGRIDRTRIDQDRRNARASELMVRDVIGSSPSSCQSSDDILTALLIMQQAKVKFLPVVNDAGVLEGMLSIDDIVPNVPSGDNRIASQWAAA